VTWRYLTARLVSVKVPPFFGVASDRTVSAVVASDTGAPGGNSRRLKVFSAMSSRMRYLTRRLCELRRLHPSV
jgi:hypothetical protein